jgi:hypothetical protein
MERLMPSDRGVAHVGHWAEITCVRDPGISPTRKKVISGSGDLSIFRCFLGRGMTLH